MKKMLLVIFAMVVFASLAMAQTDPFVAGTWVTGATPNPKGFSIDKLGAHQNGGRGCVGCHAPHSGARGNGGVYRWNDTTKVYDSVAVSGIVGDEMLWGQDLGPIYSTTLSFPDNPDDGSSGDVSITETSPERQKTGIAMCLSCHDGNVARGAMMVNRSFEQDAGMLPASYGAQPIPTLLGADGGSMGNYKNDHPVGPNATLGTVGHGAINKAKGFFDIGADSSGNAIIIKGTNWTGSKMAEFYKNYGLPTIVDARAGAGFALDVAPTDVDKAYVVCTTCHTPHSMYTTTAKPNGKSLTGSAPTFFFIAAPYNPGADTLKGTRASSATQFCRQCHFSGPGGANESAGISIPTAW